jgi:transcriptional/translational regulatory protein YebC/TACO1
VRFTLAKVEAQDAKRGKVFTKIIREIALAARWRIVALTNGAPLFRLLINIRAIHEVSV